MRGLKTTSSFVCAEEDDVVFEIERHKPNLSLRNSYLLFFISFLVCVVYTSSYSSTSLIIYFFKNALENSYCIFVCFFLLNQTSKE